MSLGIVSGSKNIDMDKMVSYITKEINHFWSHYDPNGADSDRYPIYKVPEHIFETDRTAYAPMAVSCGPYHYEAHHLQDMEKRKLEHLYRVLKLNPKRTLNDYIKAIVGIEAQTRKCYSEEVKMERKKFVQMLLRDGCFILVNIDANAGTQPPGGFGQGKIKEYQNGTGMENSNNVGDLMGCYTWHDMFLLENQIPFFVVESIYEVVAGEGAGIESLRSKATEFVADILRHYPARQDFNRPKHFHHLLHLCHMYLGPSPDVDDEHQQQHKLMHFHKRVDVEKSLDQPADCFQAAKLRTRWRRAVEYHRAGIRFKTRESEGQRKHSLLDIRFMDGVMEVPRLAIDEGTESLFKNLVALEQTDNRFGNDFSAYIFFMSHVIATPEDATMFVERGIIVHMLDSDEEVSDMFTRITKQVTFRFDFRNYLESLCQTLERHYQSRLNRWIAWLWLNHFRNPWLALAALAAGVVLFCTIVQTIYTVLGYVKVPSDI
ncbi:hypothetical protein ACP70R_033671 [Stipagrostis hirtigluma subsp. patula]